MESRRTRILLSILGMTAIISAAGILLTGALQRASAARSRMTVYEARIRALRGSRPSLPDLTVKRYALQREVAGYAARFCAPGELTPYSFGNEVKRRLGSHGLTVSRYQVVPQKGQAAVEFAATGRVAGFLHFLSDISRQEKIWSFSTLTLAMREGTDIAEVVFRVGYGMDDGKSR